MEGCWRREGCIFNCNVISYRKCERSEYSLHQCRDDNEEDWEEQVKAAAIRWEKSQIKKEVSV